MTDLNPDEAHALVAARLGRPVQDVLEAAVVLEAWGGLPAAHALTAADGVLHRRVELATPPPTAVATAKADRSLALGEVGLVLGVLFTGFWISRLADDLGTRAVDRSWRIALPVSLGLEWLLRRRYLAGADGLGRLRRELTTLALPAVVLVGAIAAIPDGGLLAVALIAIWVGGFLLTRRGWGLPYGVALVVGALVLKLGFSTQVVVTVATLLVVAVSVYAVATQPRSMRRPGPWERSIPAGLVGAGMGLLLVFEPRFAWNARGIIPVLTVVPSLLGSLWGGFHMTRLWEVMPQMMLSTSVRRRGEGAIGRLTSRLLGESIVRLVLGAGLASLAVVAYVLVTEERTDTPRDVVVSLLVAHGALAVAGLFVGLLEAFGRWGWALLATVVGVGVTVGMDIFITSDLTPGLRILCGAVVCSIVSLIPLLLLLREPDRNLAVAL